MKLIYFSYLLISLLFTGCINPQKQKTEEPLTGEYHIVMPDIELFLPDNYVYFNLEENRQRIRQKVNDESVFQWFDQMSNAYFGAKMFLDTISLTNSVTFFTEKEYVPITKNNMGILLGMFKNLLKNTGAEKEESVIVSIGNNRIFKASYYLATENRYLTYYLISSRVKTIGLVVASFNKDDLMPYIKKIRL